jgi:hypothetical protein
VEPCVGAGREALDEGDENVRRGGKRRGRRRRERRDREAVHSCVRKSVSSLLMSQRDLELFLGRRLEERERDVGEGETLVKAWRRGHGGVRLRVVVKD